MTKKFTFIFEFYIAPFIIVTLFLAVMYMFVDIYLNGDKSVFADSTYKGGESAQVVQIRLLEARLSERMRDSNIEFGEISDSLTTVCVLLDRTAHALEVQAGLE